MLIIPIRFKWKEYPLSERATKYSKILGILFSGAMTGVCCFCWFGISGFILSGMGVDEETAYGIAAIALIPLLALRYFAKKKLEEKIEAIAKEDARTHYFNSVITSGGFNGFNGFNSNQY